MLKPKAEKESFNNLLNTPSKDKWARIGMRRRSGVLAPLFSVYSKKSLGIGDFSDLELLIDWGKKCGSSIIQLLPMNEVGSLFCPYDAVSSFALEPMYISLRGFGAPPFYERAGQAAGKKPPPGKGRVDYRIKARREGLLWGVYLKKGIDVPKEFKKFIESNAYWIDDFALFKVLKSYHGGRPWYEWEEGYKNRDISRLEAFKKEHKKEVVFQMWLQYLAFKQFTGVKAYAESKKVLIMGDLPILISRDSADVWAHPEFFKLEYAAGAPPDMYCAKGQRWGMPTYNWDAISNDGYRYLKEKLRYAENFYDILRVDHVVGLFRIWSIPYDEPLENKGLNGFFDPKDENLWGEHGRRILSVMLNSTKMLLSAEDLGIIPKICPETLKELGIPGNDVERWTKDWDVKHDFLDPEDYRALSAAMLSTHDTTNWAAWWENEAGTIDEELFKRRCAERGIDYNCVKDKLFDHAKSRHGRLRWLDSVASSDSLIDILGKRPEEVRDFVEMYENTYREKDKLWRHLGLKGPVKEHADAESIAAALKVTLSSRSIFCIETIVDWLMLGDMFKGDPYRYRINTPGTISEANWSLVVPLPLEELLKHKICRDIKRMIISSKR